MDTPASESELQDSSKPASDAEGGFPCVVAIREAAGRPGRISDRFARSLRASRALWSEKPGLLRSLAAWSAAGLLSGGLAAAYLARLSTPGQIAAGLIIFIIWDALWALLVALHLGTVRSDEHPPRDRFGPPNGLTLLRILLIPVVAWAILLHDRLAPVAPAAAVLIFLVGFTDVLDGLLARWLGWQTVLGRYLDHMGDVMIISAVVLAEWKGGLLPAWLALLLLVRYLGAGTAGTLAVVLRPDVRIAPSLVGKLATAVVAVIIFAVIVHALLWPDLEVPRGEAFLATGAVVGASIAHMVIQALRGRALETVEKSRFRSLRLRSRSDIT